MALGHDWIPIIRITPPAGPAYTVTLSALSWMTVCQPSYDGLFEMKEMVNRKMRRGPSYGVRVSVHMEFEFYTPSADETTLATQVLTPAADPDDEFLFELALDNGTTYRTVDLAGFSRGPIEGKNIGVKWTLDWICRDPIENVPAVGSGSW